MTITSKKYRGLVKDEMDTLETRKTRLYNTYKEAHDKAETLCKKTMGNRGKISVEEITEYKLG
jgi:hypothetical protein